MTTTKRKVGRPPSGLPKRARRNLNIQRTKEFDGNLFKAQEIIAELNNLPVSEINQTQAVRVALSFYVNFRPCLRCNGIGYIAIRNGDDDISCEECSNNPPNFEGF